MFHPTAIEPSAAATASPTALGWDYRVRVGERHALTASLPHRLHRTRELGLTVRGFYFDLSGVFPILHARLVPAATGALASPDALAVWTEETIDAVCSTRRWDAPPLVHEECSDRWENSLIRVDATLADPAEDWAERCARALQVPADTAAALAAAALRAGEDHRSASILALPLVFAALLAETSPRTEVREAVVFQATKPGRERELLRAKVQQLLRQGELVLDPAALPAPAAALRRDFLATLRPWLTPADPVQLVTVFRALLNVLGFTPKEQDYLVLLGTTQPA